MSKNGLLMTNMVLRGANGGFGGGAGGFGGFDGAGFGGFEDIFSSFFGGGASRNPNAPRQGDDLQYRVNLKFEEAIFGAEKESSTIVKQAVIPVTVQGLSQVRVR